MTTSEDPEDKVLAEFRPPETLKNEIPFTLPSPKAQIISQKTVADNITTGLFILGLGVTFITFFVFIVVCFDLFLHKLH